MAKNKQIEEVAADVAALFFQQEDHKESKKDSQMFP